MSITRVKQPPPVQPVTPNVLRPGVNRSGLSTTKPAPSTPPLPKLIADQPLPNPTTPQYDQTQAMYAQALAQLQAAQQQQLALQAQYNRMSSQDPTAGLVQ